MIFLKSIVDNIVIRRQPPYNYDFILKIFSGFVITSLCVYLTFIL